MANDSLEDAEKEHFMEKVVVALMKDDYITNQQVFYTKKEDGTKDTEI